MDGSPRVTDVTFDQIKRGYDPSQVDTYLEELDGVVAELRRNWRTALDRADALEAMLAQAGPKPEANEETLGRALLLAQRAADEALTAARAEATNLVEKATGEAATLRDEAKRALEEARAAAEAEASHLVAEARARVNDAVADLTAHRDLLQSDVDALEIHLARQRTRLREALGELQRLVDLPEAFRAEEAPELESLDPPLEIVPPLAPEPTPAQPEGVGAGKRRSVGGDATVTQLPNRAPELQPEAQPEPEEAPFEAAVQQVELVAEPAAVEAVAPEQPLAADVLAAPPEAERVEAAVADATVAEIAVRRPEGEGDVGMAGDDRLDDTFLDELRRAVNEDHGLPAFVSDEDDEAMRAFFEADLDDPPKSRFGRRNS
jgi:DivIVA domain-containing protein